MISEIILTMRKETKRFMYEKFISCKEFLSNASNRLIAGLVLLGFGLGVGGGLIASAYIRIPHGA